MDEPLYRKLIAGIPVEGHDRVLLLSALSLAVVRDLAGRAACVQIHDVDYAALTHLRASPGSQERVVIADEAFPRPEPAFEKAMIVSPKGRDFARALIWSAYTSLVDQGELYVLGANAEGIRSVIADAGELFGAARTLAYKSRHRLGAVQKIQAGLPYPEAWGEVPTRVQARTLETPLGPVWVGTMPGVFSWQALDAGTAFLLAQEAVREWAWGADVLDVGCGTGVIGCALGRLSRSLHLVDAHLLAVECARTSARLNALSQASVYPSDVYSDVRSAFDLIVSNPPFHKGFAVSKDAAHRMIAQAPDYLRPGGRLVIVANAFLPYETFMQQHLVNVRVLAQSTQYRVLAGEKP